MQICGFFGLGLEAKTKQDMVALTPMLTLLTLLTLTDTVTTAVQLMQWQLRLGLGMLSLANKHIHTYRPRVTQAAPASVVVPKSLSLPPSVGQ